MNLRPYQKEDALLLSKLKAAACFNEQRTGKTPTALGIFYYKKIQKFLIVCPASAMFSWHKECQNWLKKTPKVAAGTPSAKQKAIDDWTEILIISYDTLKRPEYLSKIIKHKPEGIILDEAHRIRNRQTQQAKACFKLTYLIPHKLVLTGTPAPGSPEDIWSLLHFLFPKKYTSYHRWIHQNCIIIPIHTPSGHTVDKIIGLKSDAKQPLTNEIATFATSRKRVEVMPWLPDKDKQIITLPTTEKQEKYLKELSETFETGDIVTQGILDRFIRYRQICLAPELLHLKGSSPKIDWIMDYIKDYENESIIIFSNFTQFLKLLKNRIPNAKLIIGETPVKKRFEICRDFQNTKTRVLLINIKAGKEALTLDQADTTIFTDKYPPIGDIEQAEDRFVATQIEKATKPHKIIDLVMSNTYDEHIVKMLQQRKNEVDIINDFKKYLRS